MSAERGTVIPLWAQATVPYGLYENKRDEKETVPYKVRSRRGRDRKRATTGRPYGVRENGRDGVEPVPYKVRAL